VRKSIDQDSYQIRFTPRKLASIWSAVNIKKIKVLSEQGLMQPTGLAIFEKRKDKKSKGYAFENTEIKFSPAFEKQFKSNKTAWAYFQSLAPSYRKPSSNWVMSAKQEVTKLKRLNKLIADSEAGTNRWKDNKYNKKPMVNTDHPASKNNIHGKNGNAISQSKIIATNYFLCYNILL
jgi:uncharacterized protein YdeI (YjbR/CyaY-like superfamily)